MDEAIMTIMRFAQRYYFLSNFHPVLTGIEYEGMVYGSVEAAYQAAKTLDPIERRKISRMDARHAKEAGKRVTLRPDWNLIKLDVMETLLRKKFIDLPHFAKELMDTNPEELIEGNTWGDTYWGRCGGRGHNHLGRLLMKLRAELIQHKEA
jgi:ribA/ribD-fused uncharacterized protein